MTENKSIDLVKNLHNILSALLEEAEVNPELGVPVYTTIESTKRVEIPDPESFAEIHLDFITKEGEIFEIRFARIPKDQYDNYMNQQKKEVGH